MSCHKLVAADLPCFVNIPQAQDRKCGVNLQHVQAYVDILSLSSAGTGFENGWHWFQMGSI